MNDNEIKKFIEELADTYMVPRFSCREISDIVACFVHGATAECVAAAFEITYYNLGRCDVRYAKTVALNLNDSNCRTKEEAWEYYRARNK